MNKTCDGWKRDPHPAQSLTIVRVPDRYASVGAMPLLVPMRLCLECHARYTAQPGDYQDGRRVVEVPR